MWYFLVQLYFHPVAAFCKLYKNRKDTATWYVQNEKQYTKQYKNTEYTKHENKHKKKIKNNII
jgi:hypothetical protein